MNWAIILLVFWNTRGCLLQEIESIGQFNNAKFTWATGIPTLQFSSSFDCTGSGFCQMSWMWGPTNVAYAIFPSMTCTKVSSFVSLDCARVGDVLSSNLTMSNQFNTPGKTSLSVEMAGTVSGSDTKSINIQNCNGSSVGNNTGSIPEETTCEYLCNSTVVCPYGSNSSAACQYDATWSQEVQCQPETTTEAPTELSSTEPLTPEEPDNGCNKTDTNNCEEGICCACLGGIVIIAISISGSISCIVVIILLGSDFVKGQIVICVVGGCSMILGIVCGAVPLRSCSNYVIWIGGDIAAIALGSIGTFVTLIFLGYLIVVRCKPEYSLGKR